MSFNRVILGLHVAAMLIVVAAWLVMMNIEPTTLLRKNPAYDRVAIVRGAFAFAAVLSGFWSMAARPPRKESVALAISTVAAVLLLLASPF
jgi:hypothetical protein